MSTRQLMSSGLVFVNRTGVKRNLRRFQIPVANPSPVLPVSCYSLTYGAHLSLTTCLHAAQRVEATCVLLRMTDSFSCPSFYSSFSVMRHRRSVLPPLLLHRCSGR